MKGTVPLTVVLEPKPPYDFSRMVRRLEGVGHELCRYEDGALVRTIRVNGSVYGVRMRSEGTVEQPKLVIEVSGSGSASLDASADRMAIRAHLGRMLSVDTELDGLYEKLDADPQLALLSRRFHGFRFILESDPFECMIKTIIGQQLNLSFAATLNRRLIEAVSEPFEMNGRLYPVFPSPEQVAALTVDQLRERQFSQRKAEYVIHFARAVAEGTLPFDAAALDMMTNDELMERLLPFRGIGRWTVECFLLFGLGRPDLLPAADIGLRNGLRHLYRMEHQPTEDEVRQIGAAWSPWSSYITYYLWESLKEKDLHG